jgi:ATP-dependent exoDNAse (exonuclease V) alpha subunit
VFASMNDLMRYSRAGAYVAVTRAREEVVLG